MQYFTKKDIEQLFDYNEFIPYLQNFYTKKITTPQRTHLEVNEEKKGVMLIMPSWGHEKYMGVKLVNVFPENRHHPSIQGVYTLMSRETGDVLGLFDGLTLTCKRTAAVSALAGKLLAKGKRKRMLMIGTGNLSGELIKAHHTIHQFDNIGIWGRDLEKAKKKALELKMAGLPVTHVIDKDACANMADLISTATSAKEALLHGEGLKNGVYVDLVGSYLKESREADDQVLHGAKLYVDTFSAMEESGDMLIPMRKGVITREDVLGDIVGLSSRETEETHGESEKLVFKSVGFAASDLACGGYLYERREVVS